MKTRIKTGILIGVFFLAVVVLGKMFPAYCIFDLVFSALCGIATYEMLHNCKFVKSKFITVSAIVFSVYNVLCMGQISNYLFLSLYREYVGAIFVILVFIYSMFDRKNSSVVEPVFAFGMSITLGYAFCSLLNLIIRNGESGIFYLLACLIFAWITDIGAYFSGFFFGKHKLCPELSPKKTVEGAVGGVILCVFVMYIYCITFNAISDVYDANILTILLLTAPLSIVGMLGDLIFSYIKRYCGIKDYGNLLPGHGGILDRFDSILVISPVFYILSKILPILK